MQLKEELARIDAAISALENLVSPVAGDGRRLQSTDHHGTGARRRTMSAEARAKIAAAQRRRWAKQRRQRGSRTSNNVKVMPKARKGMQTAARKKISEMMKARWAARKKAA
jgi:hypothetical protein